MSSLDSAVLSVVQEFVRDGVLFTALDVSNKVKETLPLTRHREVRDLVRNMFTTDIETAGYARTPITVVLEDKSSVEALLYHPLADSWDLDTKYDLQKRSQKAAVFAPKVMASSVITGVGTMPANASLTMPPSSPFSNVQSVQAAQAASAPAVPTTLPARTAWDNLFNSRPSLFPRK